MRGFAFIVAVVPLVVLAAACDSHAVDHKCPVSYGNDLDWIDRQLVLRHDQPDPHSACPVLIGAGSPRDVYFSATAQQEFGNGDRAVDIHGQVKDRTQFPVSLPMTDDFEYFALSNNYQATANGFYQAARGEETLGATGSDWAYIEVGTYSYLLGAIVNLKYKYGTGNAQITGEQHINGMGSCVYTADVPYEPTEVQWTWYINGEPAAEGTGNPYAAVWPSGAGQYKLDAVGVDGDQKERVATLWVTIDGDGASCPYQ